MDVYLCKYCSQWQWLGCVTITQTLTDTTDFTNRGIFLLHWQDTFRNIYTSLLLKSSLRFLKKWTKFRQHTYTIIHATEEATKQIITLTIISVNIHWLNNKNNVINKHKRNQKFKDLRTIVQSTCYYNVEYHKLVFGYQIIILFTKQRDDKGDNKEDDEDNSDNNITRVSLRQLRLLFVIIYFNSNLMTVSNYIMVTTN